MMGSVVIENPKFLNIDSDLLKAKIESLKKEKETIDGVFDDFSSNVSNLSEHWSGDTGDMVSSELKKYIEYFDSRKKTLESLIEFLQNVVNSYEAFDKYISNQAGYYV